MASGGVAHYWRNNDDPMLPWHGPTVFGQELGIVASFSEDPLRVLRVMQFAAKFDFEVAPETIELSRSIKETYHSLAKERVNEEFTKMLLKGVNIRRGLSIQRFVRKLKATQP